MFSLQIILLESLEFFLMFSLNSSRPKKTQVVNHGMPVDSLAMFPYPSSDGTSSAVSRFGYTLILPQFSLVHSMWPLLGLLCFVPSLGIPKYCTPCEGQWLCVVKALANEDTLLRTHCCS